MENLKQPVTILSILESKTNIPENNSSEIQFASYKLIGQEIESRDNIIDHFQNELSIVGNAINQNGNIIIKVASIISSNIKIENYELKYDFDISRTGQPQINIYIFLKEPSPSTTADSNKDLSLNLYEIKFLNKIDLSNIKLVEFFIVSNDNVIVTSGRSFIIDIKTKN